MLFSGIGALTKKELLNLLREPRSVFAIFFPIVLFLTLFVFASTKDVENSAVVVFNQDGGTKSVDLLDRIVNAKTFKETFYVNNDKDFKKKIDTEQAFIGISIPHDFSKNITLKKEADIQVITDGRRTNASMIAYGYVAQILAKFQASLSGDSAKYMPNISVRTWYNPNKDQKWFSISNLVGIIIVSQAIILTALSIAREKEEGTFDQLLVTPIKPLGMLLGKIIPSIIIGMFMGACIMFLGNLFYGVPIKGSLLLMLFAMTVYVVSVVGIGVCVAAFANTQQQAMLGTFILQMPMTAISGFVSPVESIENPIMKWFAVCNPVMYGNRLVKGIMLKNMTFQDALENIAPLILIGFFVITISSIVFMKKYRIKMF
ncbi:MAG: ABC transporter permease [Holosporales bacterium]|jgi:ABC-2 type transport system permease protein|nr:ABC transporter permease [Holosporales bacterium]